MLRKLTSRVRGLLRKTPPHQALDALLEDPRILASLHRSYDRLAHLVRSIRHQVGDFGVPPSSQIQEIGGFKILRELGRGAMGAVYLANNEQDAFVVIKVPFTEFGTAPKWIEIFFREFQALATVRHDNIVRVHRFGKDPVHNVYYYVAEFVDGVTLKELVESKPQPTFTAAEVASITMAVLRAVRFLRDRNVSHRDLKPGNIMLTQDGIVKLIDFGAAKIAGHQSELSDAGVVMGTFDYLAPESGKAGANQEHTIGPERDVFAAGIIHYRLLKGRLPTDYGAGTTANLAFARFADSKQKALRDLSGLDPQTKRLLQQMTARDPKARLTDFDELEIRLLQIIRAEAASEP